MENLGGFLVRGEIGFIFFFGCLWCYWVENKVEGSKKGLGDRGRVGWGVVFNRERYWGGLD